MPTDWQASDESADNVHTIAQLAAFLAEHGYAPFLRGDAASWVEVQDWRIERIQAGWRAGYFERGQPTEPLVQCDTERAAVQDFLQTVSSQIYHLRTFRDAENISKLAAALGAAKIPYHRNDVPFEKLLRIFVAGRDLRRARPIADAYAG